jgi:hypothetical protein
MNDNAYLEWSATQRLIRAAIKRTDDFEDEQAMVRAERWHEVPRADVSPRRSAAVMTIERDA